MIELELSDGERVSFEDNDPVGKCLEKKKNEGIKIDKQAMAICINENKRLKNLSFDEGGIFPFTLQSHFAGKNLFYELHIQMKDRVQNIQFKSGNIIIPEEIEKIETLKASKNMNKFTQSFLKDTPNTTRLWAEMPTKNQSDRVNGWMHLFGVTKENEVYDIITKGKVEIGTSKPTFTEFFFSDNPILSGRWVLRKIPNILEDNFLNGEDVLLLWKPEDHVPYKVRHSDDFFEDDVPESVKCNLCEKTRWWDKKPIEAMKLKNQYMKYNTIGEQLDNLKNLRMGDLKGQEETFKSKFQQDFVIDGNDGDIVKLSGIIAAEGTWTDMGGRRVTYTKEFINQYINSLNNQLNQGNVIGVDRNHNLQDQGHFTSFELAKSPISHIIGHAVFNGDTTGATGFSTDVTLKAIFSESFQTWFALEGMTERVSLVDSPACKLCWLI